MYLDEVHWKDWRYWQPGEEGPGEDELFREKKGTQI